MAEKKQIADTEVIENLELLLSMDVLQDSDDWDYLLSDVDIEVAAELQDHDKASDEVTKEGDK